MKLLIVADNGSMYFWDWKTGYNFQRTQASVQPGSLDSEAGMFSMTFDMSGCRLITTEADKTIKIYKEDEDAVSNSLCIPFLQFFVPPLNHLFATVLLQIVSKLNLRS